MKHKKWKTKELLKFAAWLWDERQYSYSLLAIHGICWGLKIGNQLNLKWSYIIEQNGNPKKVLHLDTGEGNIEISPLLQKLNYVVFNEFRPKPKLTDFIYINHKTKKIIETSNLSKNLQRFSEAYLDEVYGKANMDLFEPMKGTSFQLAWALDMLEYYNYSKKSFIETGKFIGKKSLNEMIKFVDIEPIEPIEDIKMKFDLIDEKGVEIAYQMVNKTGIKVKFSDFTFIFKEQ